MNEILKFLVKDIVRLKPTNIFLALDLQKFIIISINAKHFIKIRVMVDIGKQIDLN